MTLFQLFTAIANAIRAKKGTQSTIKAEDFPTEIAGITTGNLTNEEYAEANDDVDDILENTTVPSGTINITENGSYDVTNYVEADVSIGGGPVVVNSNFASWSTDYGGHICKFIKTLPEIQLNKNSCNNIFYNFQQLESITVNFKVKPIVLYQFFQSCFNLTDVNLNGEDTSLVTEFGSMFQNCNKIKNIPSINTSSAEGVSAMFYNCYALETAPNLDLSNVTTVKDMFNTCTELKNVPFYSLPKVTNMQYMFTGCNKLTDESINNIMASCISATSYTGTKTLSHLGFISNYYSSARIQALSNYADFIAAGWTIGY